MNMICCPRCRGRGEVIENRWNDDALRKVLAERAAGASWDELAGRYDVSSTRMQQIVQAAKRKGLKP